MVFKAFNFFLLLFFAFFVISLSSAFRIKSLTQKTTEYKILSTFAAPAVELVNRIIGNSLEEAIKHAQEGTKGTYAIVVKNMFTNQKYYQKEHEAFDAASLYKLWVMVAVYEQIKEGKLNKDEVLSKDVLELNREFNIPDDEAEQTEGVITLTVDQAIFQMITISHNYAAFLLIDAIDISKVNDVLKKYGLNESNVGQPPRTTAYDMALFFEKLYNGEIIDKEYSKKMIDVLSEQTLNDRLPAHLPKNTKVAHKTGEINNFKHDAGIVFSKHGDYTVVVLSKSDMPDAAADRIADISKAVFDYFQNSW